MKKLLICGATGFIGRNLLVQFSGHPEYEMWATYHQTPPHETLPGGRKIQWIQANLTNGEDVEEAVRDKEVVIQAAAVTSGAKEILAKPHFHVTDNAVMNALLFRACYEAQVRHLIFFSCTVMYPGYLERPVKENDFNHEISDQYFGGGWTKVYAEKMAEFYSRLGPTKYTVIRHSNIYGPYDKYDLERSHVFGATVTKVMTATEPGSIVVWGDGSEERDLLYVGDLVDFVDRVMRLQAVPFELVNVGSGTSISVRRLVEKIIRLSGKDLKIEFDRTKPTIPFKLKLNIDRAKTLYQWRPRVSLDEGIVKTLEWYRASYLQEQLK